MFNIFNRHAYTHTYIHAQGGRGEAFGGDGYLAYGDGFTGIRMCPNSNYMH